jgi:hypothetical protein
MAEGIKNGEIRPGTAVDQLPVFALDDIESADAGGDVHADFIEIGLFGLPVCGLDGEIGAGQGDLDEAPHFLEFFFFDPLERIEIFHFTGDFAIKASGIKQSNGPNAALSGEEVFPGFLRADTQCADQSNARDDHPASQRSVLPCLPRKFW